MWDQVKEYFTVIFAQGFWWAKKGKTATEWVQENKTALLIILGIIALVLALVYIPRRGY
ncbi:unnamed protein product [marine sediment metagenome]|uniref:Uncharacterized protein n=1 Tax=marine sediment metagenome TaxID=412755 RepID=X1J9A8_9ZZZZ